MSDHPRVVSTFGFAPASEAKIREAANAEITYIKNSDDLLPALRESEVFCGANIPENWREVAPHLRWVQFPGAGIDSLRHHPILQADSGVLVTTASGVHVTNISEYVFWAHTGTGYALRERELHGTTLGIVGLGSIGRYIAQMARAFRMKVLATRFSARANEQDPDVDQLYPFDKLDEMLSQCDYVVIATPLTDRTEKMIGEAELRAMKSDAYLVNIGRGGVIDEEVLIRALREGWIAGAGLDVTGQEPLPPIFADNLRRYRAGQPLRNLYDARRGY